MPDRGARIRANAWTFGQFWWIILRSKCLPVRMRPRRSGGTAWSECRHMFSLLLLCTALAACIWAHRASAGGALPARNRRLADLCAAAFLLAPLLPVWLLTGRFYASLFLACLFVLVVFTVDRAKRSVLGGEPLVWSDATFAGQVCRTPGLYFLYLPWKPMLACMAALLAILGLLCRAGEPAPSRPLPALAAALLPWAAWKLAQTAPGRELAASLCTRFKPSFDPKKDAASFGLLGAALLHLLDTLPRRARGPEPAKEAPEGTVWPAAVLGAKRTRPDIVLVQSESFCDPRLFRGDIPAGVLAGYDETLAQALSGSLLVTAVGAYTMRTEHSVLTGMDPSALRADAFNPYLPAQGRPVWSLAWHLKRQGWDTICVHPFQKTFFRRDIVLPFLGFDTFLSMDELGFLPKFGPHASDTALAQWTADYIRASDRPVFCFAITMENHGPWNVRRFAAGEERQASFERGRLPEDLWQYLVHLEQESRSIALIRNAMTDSGREGVLALYGDHQPILPSLGSRGDNSTPYFIWKTGGMPASRRDLRPEELGGEILSLIA